MKSPAMKNVVPMSRPFDDPVPADLHDLDLITFLFYYHDTTYMTVDRAEMDRKMFAALKPGGVLVIADHFAKAGDGTSVGKTLHRIEQSACAKRSRRPVPARRRRRFLAQPGDTRDFSTSSRPCRSTISCSNSKSRFDAGNIHSGGRRHKPAITSRLTAAGPSPCRSGVDAFRVDARRAGKPGGADDVVADFDWYAAVDGDDARQRYLLMGDRHWGPPASWGIPSSALEGVRRIGFAPRIFHGVCGRRRRASPPRFPRHDRRPRRTSHNPWPGRPGWRLPRSPEPSRATGPFA